MRSLFEVYMTEEKKNPIAEILARKKAMQANKHGNFNPTEGKNMKSQTSGKGPTVMRKQGRGS